MYLFLVVNDRVANDILNIELIGSTTSYKAIFYLCIADALSLDNNIIEVVVTYLSILIAVGVNVLLWLGWYNDTFNTTFYARAPTPSP